MKHGANSSFIVDFPIKTSEKLSMYGGFPHATFDCCDLAVAHHPMSKCPITNSHYQHH